MLHLWVMLVHLNWHVDSLCSSATEAGRMAWPSAPWFIDTDPTCSTTLSSTRCRVLSLVTRMLCFCTLTLTVLFHEINTPVTVWTDENKLNNRRFGPLFLTSGICHLCGSYTLVNLVCYTMMPGLRGLERLLSVILNISIRPLLMSLQKVSQNTWAAKLSNELGRT